MILCEQSVCLEMASLIPKSGVIFNYANNAPAPCKDYCQIIVSFDKVPIKMSFYHPNPLDLH